MAQDRDIDLRDAAACAVARALLDGGLLAELELRDPGVRAALLRAALAELEPLVDAALSDEVAAYDRDLAEAVAVLGPSPSALAAPA